MKRPIALATAATIAFTLAIPFNRSIAAEISARDKIVGTWSLVSVERTNADGSKALPFGAAPKGVAFYDANGRYIVAITAPDLPRFASNNRLIGTADVYKAIAQGSITTFGAWNVDEAGKTISMRIESSTFPNWNGQEQTRPINKLGSDEITWTNPGPSAGPGSTRLTWRRIR